MRRFISVLMVALAMAVITALSAMPAFSTGSGGGNQVQCQVEKEGVKSVIFIDALDCVAIGGAVIG